MSLHDGSRYTARELRDRARATGLSPTLRHLFLTLDSYANGAPACWASVATLADDTGMDPRTVRRNLRKLEEAGWIVGHPGQGDGSGERQRTTLYEIADLPTLPRAQRHPGQSAPREGDHDDTTTDLTLARHKHVEPYRRSQPSGGTAPPRAERPGFRPDPKPKPRARSARLTQGVDGRVKNAPLRPGEAAPIVDDRRPVRFADAGAGEASGRPRRLTPEEKHEQRRADRRRAQREFDEKLRKRREGA